MKKILRLAEQSFTVLSLLLYSGGPLTVLLSGGVSEGDGRAVPTEYPLIQLLFLVVYAITLFLLSKRWKDVFTVVSKNRLIGLFLGLVLVSVLWSYEPMMTIRRSIALAGTTLFGIYLATRYSLKQQIQLLGWMFGLAILLSLIFALALPKYGIMGGVHTGTWRGIYLHKNALGKVMVPSAAIFLLLALDNPKKQLLFWGCFSSSIILLLLSTSKTALVSFVFLLSALCLYRFWQKHYDVIFPALLAITATICISFSPPLLPQVNALFNVTEAPPSQTVTLPSSSSETVTTSPKSTDKGKTLHARSQLWSLALEMISKRPWLGYGYGAFWLGNDGPSAYIWKITDWMPPNSHNGWLDLWLDLGIFGIVIYLIGLWKTLAKALAQVRLSRTAEYLWPIAYLTFLMLVNLTESTLVVQNNLLWVLYVAVALSTLTPSEPIVSKS
ncbi:O-antigen ligase [Leptolyngbya sp. FACHB-261]|uniref:O-antigen ligase family protein n=1 Tax=Leptolyngbya sp. FACHB-261 TaxID=2692806 RepID=UPI001682C4E7|nr:O-antigen ligase family protein [Leptolyngbya sp. FACHB-261]MBD2099688.1 O-antigen ligase family protein [Leptolyngbya sp. FACHB-261]